MAKGKGVSDREINNVIIAGAGGNLGPSIVEALDKDPHFTLSVLSRKGSSATFPSHIKVHRVDDSYPEDQLLVALKDQDAIVLLLPPSEVSVLKRIIDVSIKAGLIRVLPSEFGSDTSVPAVIEQLPFFQTKLDIRKYLQSKEETGLSWSAIVTGAFLDWGLTTAFLGFDLNGHKATIYDDGESLVPVTLVSTIAAAVASTLKNPSLTANKNVYISDYSVSQNQVLAALEKATGGDKWEVSHRSSTETRKTGLEKISKQNYSGYQDVIVAAVFGSKATDYTLDNELANGPLGLPKPEPLDVVVEKIVKGEKV